MEPTSQEATDMISNLPKEVREMILAYLPTKEAGRTSILSTDWRQAWTSIPDLVLHYDDNVEPATAIKRVDQILALHDGPIRKFDLRIMVDSAINCSDDFDRWFNHLSRNGIKELNLQLSKLNYNDLYIPSSILCSLNSLFIGRGFSVKWLEEIQGFKFLRTLTIDAFIDNDELEKLISNCPVLENLTICDSFGNRAPKINAPNLKKLYISRRLHFIGEGFSVQGFKFLHTLTIDAFIDNVELEKLISNCPVLENLTIRESYGDRAPKINAPNLKKLYISRWLHFIELYAPELIFLCLNMNADNWGPRTDLNKLFRGVPNLEILELRALFIKNLIGAELDAGKFLLNNLKELWLDLEGLGEVSGRFIQPLFHNAPNLRVLHLQIYGLSEYQDSWESMKGRDFPFQSLEVINLYGICCNDVNALLFLWFLLGSPSKLRKLIIKKFKHYCDEEQEMSFKQKVMSINISTKVQIIFEEN